MGVQMIIGLSHVSIVVPNLEAAARELDAKYGLKIGVIKVNAEQGVRMAYVELPNAKIELMEPTGANSPVAKFLERNPRGGIHHFSLGVDSVAEIRIALPCMRLHPDWGECLVLGIPGQTVRSADFAIPDVMGVQEGGFLFVGGLYGIPPDMALALSLVKRVPDFAIGIPELVAWLLLEINNRSRVRATAP